MIYHLKCGGAVRTQPGNPSVFECQQDGTTWTEKADVWQDCAASVDVERDVKVAADVESVKRLPPVRDPKAPRKGTVVEKDVVGLGLAEAPGRP